MSKNRTIRVTLGEVEFLTAEITERYHADITGATFELGLGTHEPPTAWQVADVVEFPEPWLAHASLLVNNTFDLGPGQWLWYKVSDLPEVLLDRITDAHITLI